MSEWVIVAVVGVVLLFSAKKLPDMARGLGQSMRIFKSETRGLREDEERAQGPSTPAPSTPASSGPAIGEGAPGRAAGPGADTPTGGTQSSSGGSTGA